MGAIEANGGVIIAQQSVIAIRLERAVGPVREEHMCINVQLPHSALRPPIDSALDVAVEELLSHGKVVALQPMLVTPPVSFVWTVGMVLP